MAAVGGITVSRVIGVPKPPGQQVSEITRPNINGRAFVRTGVRGLATQIQVEVDTINGSGVKNLVNNFAAMVGTIISITDDRGTTWSNLMVKDMTPLSVRPMQLAQGFVNANPNQLLRLAMTVVASGTSI